MIHAQSAGDNTPDPDDRLVTLADLEAAGLSAADVRRLDPRPTEYGPLDAPYWRRCDLLPLMARRESAP